MDNFIELLGLLYTKFISTAGGALKTSPQKDLRQVGERFAWPGTCLKMPIISVHDHLAYRLHASWHCLRPLFFLQVEKHAEALKWGPACRLTVHSSPFYYLFIYYFFFCFILNCKELDHGKNSHYSIYLPVDSNQGHLKWFCSCFCFLLGFFDH